MKKILTSILFIFAFLICNPTISDESLIGKTLYCDSTEVKYPAWKKRPAGFMDKAITFEGQTRVFNYDYLPDLIDIPKYPLWGEVYKIEINLSNIKFLHPSTNAGDFILNRQSLILKNEYWTAQCKLIETKNRNVGDEIRLFITEIHNIAKEKQRKIEAEIKSKNKI